MTAPYQPATTDVTPRGLKIARNAMRQRLWDDPIFAHRWLCHPERECKDGCDDAAIPSRWALYDSELEPSTKEVDMAEKKPRLKLVGNDSNAFSIIGQCKTVMRSAGWSREKQDAVVSELMSGDYDNLLTTALKYFDVH